MELFSSNLFHFKAILCLYNEFLYIYIQEEASSSDPLDLGFPEDDDGGQADGKNYMQSSLY